MPSTRPPGTDVAAIVGTSNVKVCRVRAGRERQPVKPQAPASSSAAAILAAQGESKYEDFMVLVENEFLFFCRRLNFFHRCRGCAQKKARRIIFYFGQNVIQVVQGAPGVGHSLITTRENRSWPGRAASRRPLRVFRSARSLHSCRGRQNPLDRPCPKAARLISNRLAPVG